MHRWTLKASQGGHGKSRPVEAERVWEPPEEQKHPVVRAYYAALVAVPRVTGRCAVAVMGQYKTLRSLLEAYRLAEQGGAGSGRLLLQDLPVTKPSGGTQRFGARSQPPTPLRIRACAVF